jgi:hypothetical protein
MLSTQALGTELATRVRSAVSAVAFLTGQSEAHAESELASLAGVVVNPVRQDRIAQAYDTMPRIPYGMRELREACHAWTVFALEIRAQWDALHSLGFSLTVESFDPYAGPAEMFADVADYRIRVLATDVCGEHPYLSNEDNDLFRAVHDILGHAATGRGFDRHGEEAAYQSHCRMFSPVARLALATETRGQNASLHSNGRFPVQRLGILPGWARETDALAFGLPITFDDMRAEAAAHQDAHTYALREGIAQRPSQSL